MAGQLGSFDGKGLEPLHCMNLVEQSPTLQVENPVCADINLQSTSPSGEKVCECGTPDDVPNGPDGQDLGAPVNYRPSSEERNINISEIYPMPQQTSMSKSQVTSNSANMDQLNLAINEMQHDSQTIHMKTEGDLNPVASPRPHARRKPPQKATKDFYSNVSNHKPGPNRFNLKVNNSDLFMKLDSCDSSVLYQINSKMPSSLSP